jgi:hypothetical protein
MTTVFDKSTTQVKWKGLTFQQLASSIKLNKSDYDTKMVSVNYLEQDP